MRLNPFMYMQNKLKKAIRLMMYVLDNAGGILMELSGLIFGGKPNKMFL